MSPCYEFNYTSNEPQPLPDVWVPCPSGDNCCLGTDLCLSNNICHFVGSSNTKAKRESGYSSYYNARCTDPTYTSPACDKICIGSPPDIVYNFTSERWACCGNNTAGEVTCFDPIDEYYAAPAPQSLATLSAGASFNSSATLTPWAQYAATAVTTSGGSSTTSQSTITPGPSASSSTPSSSQSSDLSTGAPVGIGVGVALGVIALLAIIAFFLFRRRRSQPGAESVADQQAEPQDGPVVSELANTWTRRPVQTLPKPHKPVFELGNDSAVYEVENRTS